MLSGGVIFEEQELGAEGKGGGEECKRCPCGRCHPLEEKMLLVHLQILGAEALGSHPRAPAILKTWHVKSLREESWKLGVIQTHLGLKGK